MFFGLIEAVLIRPISTRILAVVALLLTDLGDAGGPTDDLELGIRVSLT